MLGICCGAYTTIAPSYIKDIAPFPLRALFGSFIGLGRIIGIVVCYGIGVILYDTNVWAYYRIMFVVPGSLAVIQSILFIFVMPDSPLDMLEQYKHETLREYVQEYYKEEAVDTVVKEY